MSGEDAPRPYLQNLIVPEIKTNKQTNKACMDLAVTAPTPNVFAAPLVCLFLPRHLFVCLFVDMDPHRHIAGVERNPLKAHPPRGDATTRTSARRRALGIEKGCFEGTHIRM
jgi:hypothetical protein